jgi:glutaminyl-peptide cyclotransferase
MKKSLIITSLFIIAILVLSASIFVYENNNKPQSNPSAVIHYSYTIINTSPHDTNAFTEGLVFSEAFFYESTGISGFSSLRRVNTTTGIVQQQTLLPSKYFGEGLTIVNNKIIQLTWQTHVGFIYNKTTFSVLGNFSYATEGWGLTFDGKHLIMSDGTDNLYFLDPTTFQRTGQVVVHDGNTTIVKVNELEYIKGDVYANIWQTNTIAIINPQTGQVKGWIDLTGLQDESNPDPNAVLNGIAYDQNNNRLFVTGKDWSSIYQIKLVPQSSLTD